MMLNDERILTFSQATKSLPSIGGKPPHSSTIWRWARKGISGVHLEVRRIGGRFVTSAEALERFTAALAAIPPNQRRPICSVPKVRRPRTPKQRERDMARAAEELRARGFDLPQETEPAKPVNGLPGKH